MPTAEIIAIGTELLLGEIQDTNTRYLARKLRDGGIDLYRTHIIGDNADRIAGAIKESLTRCQIVVTTGGLGPTVDDPTRQAVALALGVPLEFREDLWEQILERFKRFGRNPTENNRRQAYIPQNSIAVENPVGTAPSFFCETLDKVIISLPGVPREMEHLFENRVMPYLRSHYDLQGTIKACVIHCAGVGESQVDEWIADLETLANPSVGLLAHPGIIDIRITAKAQTIIEADRMIQDLIPVIESRLGDNIFGKDEQTLETSIHNHLEKNSWKLEVHEFGSMTQVISHFKENSSKWIETRQHSETPGIDSLTDFMSSLPAIDDRAHFACSFIPGEIQQLLHMYLRTPLGDKFSTRSYGGPPGNGPIWATNTALDFIRRNIQLSA